MYRDFKELPDDARVWVYQCNRSFTEDEQKQLHQYFSFKLAAVRNLYLSKFLKDHDPEGARLKEELATLFGQAHLSCLKEDYQELSHLLYQIAEVDDRFRDLYVN